MAPASHWGASPDFSLLEREEEIAVLAQQFERAAAGSGRVVLVEGEGGIGKSSLIAGLHARAQTAGATVLGARGGRLERDFPYGVVRQLFEPISRAGGQHRRALLRGAARMAGPVLGLSGTMAAEFGGPEAQVAANHGLYWLTANLAEEAPVVLSIDDAHWSDGASLLFAHYLGRRVEGLPVLIVLALRPGEPGSDAELLGAIHDLPEALSVRPAPLSSDATAHMVRLATGAEPDPALVEACHEVTGGNPFLVIELLRALELEPLESDEQAASRVRRLGPRSISRSVLGRLAVMWPAAASLARAAAVLDTDAELAHAAALGELGGDEAADAADALTEAHVFASGTPLRFAHPIIRQSVYEDMPPRRRARAHARAAEILAASGQASRAAVHLLATDPAGDQDVVARLREAALHNVRRGAPGVAATLLRRALAEPPPDADRDTLMLELGRASRLAGEPEAVELLHKAFEAADEPATRLAAARELVAALVAAGEVEAAAEVLEQIATSLDDGGSESRLLLEAEVLTASTFDDALASRAAERIDRMLEGVTGGTPAERVVLAGAAFHRMAAGTGTGEEIAALAAAATRGGLIVDEQGAGSPYPSMALSCLLFTDRHTDAVDVLEAMARSARRTGSPHAYAWYSTMCARHEHVRGEPPAAAESARTALDLFSETLTLATEMALAFLVFALVEQGELEQAQDALARYGADSGRFSQTTSGFTLLLARSALRLDQGRVADAAADAEAVVERERERGGSLPGRGFRWVPLLALHAAGEDERAVGLAKADVAAARRFGIRSAEGISLAVLGVVQGGSMGLRHLARAATLLEDSPRRLDRAHALIELGAALRRAGRRADAREPLGQGMDLAHRLGAAGAAQRARQELLALGARPRRLVLTGVDALTASELRVAELAARGLANPEIAQMLFVTRKTVEAHLMSVYRKLDVSREGLREALTPSS